MSTALAPSVTRHDKIVKGTSCHLRTIRDKLSGGPIVRGPVDLAPKDLIGLWFLGNESLLVVVVLSIDRLVRPEPLDGISVLPEKKSDNLSWIIKKLSSFSWRSRQQFQGFVSRPSEQFFAQDIVFKMEPFFNFKRKNIIWHPGLEPSTFWLDFGSLWHLLSIHQHVLFAVTSNKKPTAHVSAGGTIRLHQM